MRESALATEIQIKLADRVAALHGRGALRDEYPFYVKKLEHNLASWISSDEVRADFSSGSGGELVSSGGRPEKLYAVHSSAALAVNTFGHFRTAPESLVVGGRSGFVTAQFEKKLRTGLGGTPPNLDFFALGDDAIVAVEGKLTEILGRKHAGFASSYANVVGEIADRQWEEMYLSLCSAPTRFRYVDAAQLVKHYLGLRNSLRDESQPKILLYLFWEPSNWPDVPSFAKHRKEVLDFSMSVAGGEVEFMAMSYAELWDEWKAARPWAGVSEHVDYLRDRYVFAV